MKTPTITLLAAATALTLTACATEEPTFTDEQLDNARRTTCLFDDGEDRPDYCDEYEDGSAAAPDGRIAMDPNTGPATEAEDLAVIQVRNDLEAVGLSDFTNLEILEYGRSLCKKLDIDPGQMGEQMNIFHKATGGTQASIMVPPVTAREFCPSHFPSESGLESMVADVWGGETWTPGVN